MDGIVASTPDIYLIYGAGAPGHAGQASLSAAS